MGAPHQKFWCGVNLRVFLVFEQYDFAEISFFSIDESSPLL